MNPFDRFYNVIKFLAYYFKSLVFMSGPHKGLLLLTLIIFILNSVREIIFTFGIIGFGASYLNTSNELPEIYELSVTYLKNIFVGSFNLSNEQLIILFLLVFLILRQILQGIQLSFQHFTNNLVAAHIRTQIVKNLSQVSIDKKDHKSGSIEQVISQDSKFTSQTLIIMFKSISSFFLLLCMGVLMFDISVSLFFYVLLISFLIVPFKYFYSMIIVKAANRSKSLEYNLMNLIADITSGISDITRNTIDKFKTRASESSAKETRFRLLLAWEPVIIQVIAITLVLFIFINLTNNSALTATQLASFGFLIYRSLPYLTKASKDINSFISRRELVNRTYKKYINNVNE